MIWFITITVIILFIGWICWDELNKEWFYVIIYGSLIGAIFVGVQLAIISELDYAITDSKEENLVPIKIKDTDIYLVIDGDSKTYINDKMKTIKLTDEQVYIVNSDENVAVVHTTEPKNLFLRWYTSGLANSTITEIKIKKENIHFVDGGL